MEKFKQLLIQLTDMLHKRKRIVLALSCLVVFMTTYLLILPAFTLEKDEAIKQGGIDIGTEASEDVSDEKSDAVTVDEDETVVEPSDVKKAGKKAKTAKTKDAPSEPLTFEGEGFSVAVEDASGVLPEKTSIEATELIENPTEGTKAERKAAAEEYRNYYEKALEAINNEAKGEGEKKISFVKFYDITLQSGDETIQPEKPVNVTISYDEQQQKELKVEEKKDVRIIHFAKDEETSEITAEIVDDKNVDVTLEKSRMTDTTFEAEGFSVYGVVYTVDFEYVSDVDGKTYEYSIKGGEGIGLIELLPVLGVIKDDKDTDINEVDEFISQIAEVRINDPELVSVSKADEDTTVGAIKDALSLECEYSADLTEDQITKINNKKVKSGDWALISLRAFNTEETLTITLKNGDQFTIKVTDAQVSNADNLITGESYLLYIERGGQYYALDRQGRTVRVNNNDLEALCEDANYLWRFTSHEDGSAHWNDSCSMINGSNWLDVYYSYENHDTQPWYWSQKPDKNYPIAPTQNNWEPIISLASADDGGFYFRDLNNYEIYLSYVGDHVRTISAAAYRDAHPYWTIPSPVSVHIYRPGTAYTVTLRSDNDANGSVKYTLNGTQHQTSASNNTISISTGKNEDTNKTVLASITVEPAPGYKFTGWTEVQVNYWDDYHVTDWGSGANSESDTILPTVSGNLILQANFEPEKLYTFTVRTDNEEMGTVGGGDINGETVTGQVSFQSTTGAVINDRGRNAYELTAKSKPLHKFVKWELKDSNGVLIREITDPTIAADSLELTGDEMTLTAVFAVKTETEIDNNDINTLLDNWKTDLTGDFVGVDKTAHVHDYENRIYEIDLSASSGKWAVERSINLDIITDTSRSMYFPANLEYAKGTEQASTFNNLEQWLNNNAQDTSQVYYVVSANTPSDNSATMYAVYYKDGGWKYKDASYYRYIKPGSGTHNDNPVPSNRNVINGRVLTGIIYKSSDAPAPYVNHSEPASLSEYWSRLDYLYKAVMTATETLKTIDENSAIHLTTFNKYTENKGYLGATDFSEDAVYNQLKGISPSGGTRQDRGLWTARTGTNISSPTGENVTPDTTTPVGSNSAFQNNSDHQQFAIIITDGAPNIQNTNYTPTSIWNSINAQAGELKDITDNQGRNLTLMTLGIGSDFIGDNKGKFDALASAPKYAENANNGGEIVQAIKDLVQDMVMKANLYGTVSDKLDPAFYPVKADGTPIEAGYYDMNGDPYTPGQNDTNAYCQWTRDGEVWTVTYYNQTFKWPERDSNSNITKNGWEQAFYVKAKEDFLGGNTIETNGPTNENTKSTVFTATHTILLDENGSERPETKKEIKDKNNQPAPIVKNDVPTPHVNVKQLTLDGNSTRWTVYIEKEVEPLPQIIELYNNIEVLEVVDSSTNNMITDNEHMMFEPGTGTVPETFLLKDLIDSIGEEVDWSKLKGEPGYVEIPYTGYEHNAGIIRLSLTKEGASANYEEHQTSSSHSDTEKYVLTAQYIPYTIEQMQQDDTDGGGYHTTKNESAGTEQQDGRPCNNVHDIDLFVRGISITKADETFTNSLPGAEFTVYRKATAEEIAGESDKIKTFDGDSDKYYPDHELDFDNTGVAYKNGVKAYDSITKYYLVETKAPDGYNLLEDPIPVHLTITDTYTILPVEEVGTPQEVKPNSGLYNWEQKAKLEMKADSGIMRTSSAYDPNDPTTDWTHTGIEASSRYEVMYYRIANNPGVELPHTGGPGTRFFTILGSILILGAGVLLWRKRRLV